jgi:hypothetical protein
MWFARLIPLTLPFLAGAVGAQAIPQTAAAAEAEGALFARDSGHAAVAPWVARPSRGTGARRCTPPSMGSDSAPTGALRSGEFAVRTRFTVHNGFRANEKTKALWLPLHPRTTNPTPLLIRAVRVGHISDTLRQAVSGLARSRAEFGYPSTLSFPVPGEWLVVATAGADWGCFVFAVEP